MPMSQAKQPSKRKRRSKALPVLGAAGLSLSLVGTASAVPGGPAVNLPTSGNGDGNQVFLGEEEISDVSLATFYIFDGGACRPWRRLSWLRRLPPWWWGVPRWWRLRRLPSRLRLPRLRRLPPRLRRLRLRQLWDRLWWLRRVGWLRRVRRRRVVLVARPSHLVRLVKRSFVCSDPGS